MEGLNEIDGKILELLKRDARMNYTDIAKEVGISRVSVKTKIDAMINKGIIREFKVITDETKAYDNYVEFLLDIEINPEFYNEVLDDLGKEKEIRKLVLGSGRGRVMAFGYFLNQRMLSSYVDKLYWRMRGIKAIATIPYLSTLKDVDRGVEYVPGEHSFTSFRRQLWKNSIPK